MDHRARRSLSGERGRVVIEHDSMAEYYGGLYEVAVAAQAANAS